MKFIVWVHRWYDERRRKIDLKVYWPLLRHHAFKKLPNDPDEALELAREAFIVHMSHDPLWARLADGWSGEQLGDFVRSNLI